jgi:hypothetical protein
VRMGAAFGASQSTAEADAGEVSKIAARSRSNLTEGSLSPLRIRANCRASRRRIVEHSIPCRAVSGSVPAQRYRTGRGFRPLSTSTNMRKSPGRALTDGAGGFLPSVLLCCLGGCFGRAGNVPAAASKQSTGAALDVALCNHSSIAFRPAAVILRRTTSTGLAPAFIVSRSAVASRARTIPATKLSLPIGW